MIFVTEMIATIDGGELDRAGCVGIKRFPNYPAARKFIKEWYDIANDPEMPSFDVVDYNNEDYLRIVEYNAHKQEDWYHIFNIVSNS